MKHQVFTTTCAGLLGCLLVSCASTSTPAPNPYSAGQTAYLDGMGGGRPTTDFQFDSESYWDHATAQVAQGPARVEISISQQKAYFYKGSELVGVSRLSTGRGTQPTPAGQYTILEKTVDKKSNLYGSIVDGAGNVVIPDVTPSTPRPPGTFYKPADMPYWMRLTSSGVGMHAGYLPGYPASRGCIRMPDQMAQTFFHNVSLGTPVTIRP